MNKLLIFMLFIFLTGCNSMKERPPIERADELVLNTVEICEPDEFMVHDRPDPISTLPVTFFVVTSPDDTLEFFTTNESGLIIKIEDYENLGLNMQEILRYIKQSNDLLYLYENKEWYNNNTKALA